MSTAVSAGTVLIKGVGAICSVGVGIRQVHASVMAGLGKVSSTSIYDASFEPIRMALVPEEAMETLIPEVDRTPLTARQRRMVRLAAPALREAATAIPEGVARVPLFVGLPEEATGSGQPIASKQMVSLFARQAGIPFDKELSQAVGQGRAAALLALEAAIRLLAQGQVEVVIAGGVDTYLDLKLLAQLDSEKRILGERVADGFVPGEGAAFLVLSTNRHDKSHRKGPGTAILGVASARDPGHRYSDQPARGEGLSRAIAELMAALPRKPGPSRTVFAGFNGESFGAKEWGVAGLRCGEFFAPGLAIEHPADCFGDTGAASAALLMALAAQTLSAGNRSGPALVFASSGREQRACALLDVLA